MSFSSGAGGARRVFVAAAIRLVSRGATRLTAGVSTASPFHLVVIMGVAGSGKSTIGRLLADSLGWAYFEADDFHPPENIAKMSRGVPLTDADREPWLRAIRDRMDDCAGRRRPAVFTCSALKASYRRVLTAGLGDVVVVHLSADPALVEERLRARSGHFMKADMVRSQFAALEQPADALTIDARNPPAEIVASIRAKIGIAP